MRHHLSRNVLVLYRVLSTRLLPNGASHLYSTMCIRALMMIPDVYYIMYLRYSVT